MTVREMIKVYFGKRLRTLLDSLEDSVLGRLEEIRVRLNKPLMIKTHEGIHFLNSGGAFTTSEHAYLPTKEDITQIMELISEYSIYAFNEDIKKGFITLKGGYRVGVVGKAIIENDEIIGQKQISALNFRIRRELKGCSEKVIDYIEGKEINSTLIISPPACGKTTLLRDIARQISDNGHNVGIVDERSELAATYLGQAQNDVGVQTDVVDSCPKAIGMRMLLRSMSSEVIVVDEIGSLEDAREMLEILNSGVALICSVHGNSIDEVLKRSALRDLIEKGAFKRFIVLNNSKGAGTIEGIYTEEFKKIYGGLI